MNSVPDPSPMHMIDAPTWARLLFMVVVVSLLILSTLVTVGALWASGKSLVSWPRLKSMAATGLWVACALGVVAYVGLRSQDRVTAYTAEMMPEAEDSYANAANSGLPQRLGIRQTSSDAPEWAVEPVAGSHNPARIILSSQRFATLEEAERQITERAAAEVRVQCSPYQPGEYFGDIPVDLINKYAVKELVGEVIPQYDFGNGIKGTMYRAHLWLDAANPKLKDSVLALWHSELAERRLIVLGGATGLLTLMLGSVAGYFRLDNLTGGRYRGRLKLAAASLVTAGGLVAASVVG